MFLVSGDWWNPFKGRVLWSIFEMETNELLSWTNLNLFETMFYAKFMYNPGC